MSKFTARKARKSTTRILSISFLYDILIMTFLICSLNQIRIIDTYHTNLILSLINIKFKVEEDILFCFQMKNFECIDQNPVLTKIYMSINGNSIHFMNAWFEISNAFYESMELPYFLCVRCVYNFAAKFVRK